MLSLNLFVLAIAMKLAMQSWQQDYREAGMKAQDTIYHVVKVSVQDS